MKAYSHDLRTRIFNYSLTHSIRNTAKVFQVGVNTVTELRRLFIETNSLEPRQRSSNSKHLIKPEDEINLQLLVAENCDATLEQLCESYERYYGVKMCTTTMFNTLNRMGITRNSDYDSKKNDACNLAEEIQ